MDFHWRRGIYPTEQSVKQWWMGVEEKIKDNNRKIDLLHRSKNWSISKNKEAERSAYVSECVGILCCALSFTGGVTQGKDDRSFIQGCHGLNDVMGEQTSSTCHAWKKGRNGWSPCASLGSIVVSQLWQHTEPWQKMQDTSSKVKQDKSLLILRFFYILHFPVTFYSDTVKAHRKVLTNNSRGFDGVHSI